MRVVVAATLGGLFGWFAAPQTLLEWVLTVIISMAIGLCVVVVADALEN